MYTHTHTHSIRSRKGWVPSGRWAHQDGVNHRKVNSLPEDSRVNVHRNGINTADVLLIYCPELCPINIAQMARGKMICCFRVYA